MNRICFTFGLLFASALLCACSAGTKTHEEVNLCSICTQETSSQIYFDDYYGHGYVCADCFLSAPEDFIRCQDCGAVVRREHRTDIQVCERCREAYYRTCILCEDRLFHRDEMARVGKYCLCARCTLDLALRFDSEEEIIRYIEANDSLPYSGFYDG